MRIALFTDTFPPEVNGVANTVARLARAMVAKGHIVCVFTASALSVKELRAQSNGEYYIETIPSIGLPIYLGVRITAPIGLSIRKVSRFKPDMIHSHTPFSLGLEAIWASRFLKVPLIGTHHTFFNHYLKHVHLNYRWAEWLSWRLTVAYYNKCDVVISPTHSLVDELLANGLKKPYKIIPNIVDTELFRPAENKSEIKNQLGLSDKVVVYMGRVSYEKSIDQAIQSFDMIVQQDPEAEFLIIGDGPEKDELISFSRKVGIEERIQFCGFLHGKELVEHLQASDVFITASKSENMPLAVLEAMACGLPVVAAKSLGLAEIVEHEKNGFLVPPDDPTALSTRTLEILRDSKLQSAFSESSRLSSKQYSEPAVITQLEHVYSKFQEN